MITDKVQSFFSSCQIKKLYNGQIQKQKHAVGTFPVTLILFALSFAFNSSFLLFSIAFDLAPSAISLMSTTSLRNFSKAINLFFSTSLCRSSRWVSICVFRFEFKIVRKEIELNYCKILNSKRSLVEQTSVLSSRRLDFAFLLLSQESILASISSYLKILFISRIYDSKLLIIGKRKSLKMKQYFFFILASSALSQVSAFVPPITGLIEVCLSNFAGEAAGLVVAA